MRAIYEDVYRLRKERTITGETKHIIDLRTLQFHGAMGYEAERCGHEEDKKRWVHLGPYKHGGQALHWEQETEGFIT